ncbi:internal virion protein [Sinorhizobium phage PBC5]|uniref:internal virion protein n=1 Tax=Sinorhizobium phage PBC5 TaxID=179237 RepID=UPI001BEA096C|nr:internal virion protein [Sinorhizobium phage PBC5]
MNVRLNDGGLTPINKPIEVATIATASQKTIYRHQGSWLSWPNVVNAVPGPVAQDRLYFTGDGAPKVKIGGVDYALKVPRPTGALTAALSGTGSGDIQSRTYVYTWVTSFGEESAPCPASIIVDWKPGQTVTLSGFAATPGGRSITTQRIYRSQTGKTGTGLYLIAERAASAGNFTDNIAVDQFQEPLPSADWNEPPDGLAGLAEMPNGMMAAFVGRSIYFCEPYRPHAWPEKYSRNVGSDIVGIAALGSILVVVTKGKPYLLAGTHPDSMQQQQLEENLPCINARSIVDLGHAVCYASNDGLVAVRGDGSIRLVTEQLLSREKWLDLSPFTIIGGQINGAYLLFYDNLSASGERIAGSISIYVDGQPFLVRSSEIASSSFFDIGDTALYFMAPGSKTIQRFDAPQGAPQTLYWRSKEFITTSPSSMGAVLVDSGSAISLKALEALQEERNQIIAANAALFAAGDLQGGINARPLNDRSINGDDLQPVPPPPTAADAASLTVSIFADGKLIQTIDKVDRIARVRAGLKARKWEVAISTNMQIAQVIMAASVEELKQVL